MTALQRALLSLAVVVPVSVAGACTSDGSLPAEASSGTARAPRVVEAETTPSPRGHEPLAAELKRLKQAIDAQDPAKLQELLSPGGVLCGDYLYGRAEYDILVRRPEGRLRSWLFGTGAGGRRSVKTYLDSGTPIVSSESATQRRAEYSYAGGSLLIGFTLTNGRWLITEGLFCE